MLDSSLMDNQERAIAKIIMLAAIYLGRASMLLFVVFLFVGSLGLVELGLSHASALLWDGLLSLLFFAQHSGMIRRSFRAGLTRLVPPHYIEAVFSLVSSLLLIAVVLFWQSSTAVIVELEGVARWAARGVFLLGMAGLVWGVIALKSLDPFGAKAIKNHLEQRQPRPQQFQAKGPYLWVRHPLYFFLILLIWSCPDLTADRLLFNILWTAWIWLGSLWEERDLVADFGEEYRAYQKQVPMLLPWKVPAKTGKPDM